jgi:hypothetical protein
MAAAEAVVLVVDSAEVAVVVAQGRPPRELLL